MGKLDGKVAVISGAGHGLGYGIALRLGYEGAKVAVIGRTKSKLVVFQTEMENRGYEALYTVGDVASREDVKVLVKAAADKWGRIDAVVNNAMTSPPSSIETATDDEIDIAWNSSLKGSLYMMQECYPWFKKAGHGKVVNFCSIAAICGNKNRVPYSIAKSALGGLTRAAAVEWGRDNIQVNAISPSAAPIDFWANFTKTLSPEALEFSRKMYCGYDCGVDSETHIGAAVAFLCSDDSDWITSRTLYVDGGQGWRR